MGDVLRSWFRARLGIIIDLTPEIFRHYTSDGTLLAKILHSYDVINDIQLHKIIPTQDPAMARINLKQISTWLHFIGVDCDKRCFRDISNKKGSASIKLFYKVFLCLEKKDRLHFITLLEERKKFMQTSEKLGVKVVQETKPLGTFIDRAFVDEKIMKSASVIEWHKEKFQTLINDCKKYREEFRASQDKKDTPTTSFVKLKKLKNNVPKKIQLQNEDRAAVDEFDRKHPPKIQNFDVFQSIYSTENQDGGIFEQKHQAKKQKSDVFSLTEKTSKQENIAIVTAAEDREAARNFIKSLKSRKRQKIIAQNTRSQMQKLILSELWRKMDEEQERNINKIAALKILNQSRYEKKLVKTLLDIQSEKNRILERRRKFNHMVQDRAENDLHMEAIEPQEYGLEADEEEDGSERFKELHKMLNDNKRHRDNEKYKKMGSKLTNDIIDFSINLAEYQIMHNDKVPSKILNEWKDFFFRSLPIEDYIESPRNFSDFEDECIQMFEEIRNSKDSTNRILDDRDFDNYNTMQGPWEEFISEIDENTEVILNKGYYILGYIVHKSLEVKYPFPPEPRGLPLCHYPVRVALLGVYDPFFHINLVKLLEEKNVKVVSLIDSVKYCIQRYKDEMKEHLFLDLDFSSASTDTIVDFSSLSFQQTKSSVSEHTDYDSIMSPKSSKNRFIFKNFHKQTQTPRMFTNDEVRVVLSDTAYVGKWAHNFLIHGESIPDDLMSRIITQYLKDLEDVKGWVIMDYPNSFQQLSSLEYELTGQIVPIDYAEMDIEEMNHEEIDSQYSSIDFRQKGVDFAATLRLSRLVPNPINADVSSRITSHLTNFIKLIPMEKKPEDDSVFLEMQFSEENSVDKFYSDQGIASFIHYSTLDDTMFNKISQLIFGDDAMSDKLSVQVLYECSNMTEGSETASIENSMEYFEKIFEENLNAEPKLDEITWQNFPHDPQILRDIADLWENLEAVYIDRIKMGLSTKRLNFLSIVPYSSFVTKHMMETIDRLDEKQNLLFEFQKAFNEVENEIRQENEIKCELYYRIKEFESKLWEICDDRRVEAEEKRKKIIFENWTAFQIIILTNAYLEILQAEIDRFFDTLKILNIYYSTIVKWPIEEDQFSKFPLNQLSIDDENSNQDIPVIENILNSPPIPETNLAEIKNEIHDFIIQKNNSIDPTKTLPYKVIKSNIKYIQLTVEKLYFSLSESFKKEGKTPRRISRDRQRKKRKSKQLSMISSDLANDDIIKQSALNTEKWEPLFNEWKSLVDFEFNRISLRLNILEQAFISDVRFLLNTVKYSFDNVKEKISEHFRKQMENVNHVMKIFRHAVEEGKSIQEELILDGSKLLIDENSLMYSSKSESILSHSEDNSESSMFKLSQLSKLKNIFKKVAPYGNMSPLPMTYILQDFIAFGDKNYEEHPLPSIWHELQPQDVVLIVNEIFGHLSPVNWKEFLIFAMNIEMPNIDQLLNMQAAYKRNDIKNTGVIHREHFFQVPLWFPMAYTRRSSFTSWLHDDFKSIDNEIFNEITWQSFEDNYSSISSKQSSNRHYPTSEETSVNDLRSILIRELLFEMFSVSNDNVDYSSMLLSICKDKDPKEGLTKALSVASGKKLCSNFEEGEEYVMKMLKEKKELDIEKLKKKALEETKAILDDLINNVCKMVRSQSSDHIHNSTTNDNHRLSGRMIFQNIAYNNETPSQSQRTSGRSFTVSLVESAPSSISSQSSIKNQSMNRETSYWLGLDIFEDVVSTIDPQIINNIDLYRFEHTFNENMIEICGGLNCLELNSDENLVLAHRLINHELVIRFINNTSSFWNKNLTKIVRGIIQRKEKKKNEVKK